METESTSSRANKGNQDRLDPSQLSASTPDYFGRIVDLGDWKRSFQSTGPAGAATTRVDDRKLPVSPTGAEGSRIVSDDNDHVRTEPGDGIFHGKPPSVRGLARQFLEELLRRARRDNFQHLKPLRDFRDQHRDVIAAGHRLFFEELIRTMKASLRFVSCPQYVSKDMHVADFLVEMKGDRLMFVALECVNVGHNIFPADSLFFTRCKEMGARSDTELLGYIKSFNDVDRPWLLFAAIFVVGERRLPVRLSGAPHKADGLGL